MGKQVAEIKRDVIQSFKQGKWQQQAVDYVSDTKKMSTLLMLVLYFIRHKSIRPLLKNLVLLYNYVKDIIAGSYVNYNMGKMVFVVAVLLYVVSPLDLIPDFITGLGLLDDTALVGYAVHVTDKELKQYLRWRGAHKKCAEN